MKTILKISIFIIIAISFGYITKPETVQVYDANTKTVTTIPKKDLGKDMVSVEEGAFDTVIVFLLFLTSETIC